MEFAVKIMTRRLVFVILMLVTFWEFDSCKSLFWGSTKFFPVVKDFLAGTWFIVHFRFSNFSFDVASFRDNSATNLLQLNYY